MRRLTNRVLSILVCLIAAPAASAGDMVRSFGETIYVPAYSRIFSYPARSQLLAATLTVHNVDPGTSLTVERVDYHGEDGTLIAKMLEAPLELRPMESASFLLPINDTTGGVGANFLVDWSAGAEALGPLTETVMVGAPGTPGPSFTSRGRVIDRRTEAP